MQAASKRRWTLVGLLLPAALVYSLFMIYPLVGTLWISFFHTEGTRSVFVGLANYQKLLFEPAFSSQFINAVGNNFYFFIVHIVLQNPIGIAIAAVLSLPKLRFRSLYRGVFFLPTMLSVVLVGFVWQLILSPIWGVSAGLLSALGLSSLFRPWLGLESTALTTLSLISVWQNIGIPMMLIYAALLSIPDEVLDAARIDGASGWELFWGIKLPLIMPTIALGTILTFIGNFNAFDLVFTTQGALGLPNFSTDLLGTFMYRTFFGTMLQIGDINLGATVAMMMFLVILAGVSIYLFLVQRRIATYEL
jgi:raffinose/stachyose/melibiose transport system permease protein